MVFVSMDLHLQNTHMVNCPSFVVMCVIKSKKDNLMRGRGVNGPPTEWDIQIKTIGAFEPSESAVMSS